MLAIEELSRALRQDDRLTFERLELLPPKGLAHDHVRLTGSGLLLRIPKQSQRGYQPHDNLIYQAACFDRVQRSGYGPGLALVLPPSAALPLGALLVEEIFGRPLALAQDLPLLADSLAAIHRQDLPPPTDRPPLEDHHDPVRGLYQEIKQQAAALPEAGLHPSSLDLLREELVWAQDFQRACQHGPARQPQRLVLTDTHPGNFLVAGPPSAADRPAVQSSAPASIHASVQPGGGAGGGPGGEPGGDPSGGISHRDDRPAHAVIVDLEKALYGSPAIDLAHATIYSSTTWDLETQAVLSPAQVGAFYRHYLTLLPDALRRDLRPWLLPLRRLLWLRAMTWCAFWQVQHQKAAKTPDARARSARDWSAEKTSPRLIAHVAERVSHYLAPDTLGRMQQDWKGPDNLEGYL